MHAIELDPNAPGLDMETRRRRRVLAKMQRMSTEQLFQLAVQAEIYTADGKLAAPYRDEPGGRNPHDPAD